MSCLGTVLLARVGTRGHHQRNRCVHQGHRQPYVVQRTIRPRHKIDLTNKQGSLLINHNNYEASNYGASAETARKTTICMDDRATWSSKLSCDATKETFLAAMAAWH